MHSVLNASGFFVFRDETQSIENTPFADGLDNTQIEVIDNVLRGQNILIHGPAGVGKSFVITKLMETLQSMDVVTSLWAFTGAAAIHVGGTTIHSFFKGLGLMKEEPAKLYRKFKRQGVRSILRVKAVRVLIIDEISMVSTIFFDKLDQLLRLICQVDIPFGGKQLVICGDFYQLPPIETRSDGAVFVFESDVWSQLNIQTITLSKVYRQMDTEFVEILHKIRVGKVDVDVIGKLIERVDANISNGEIVPTSLFATNQDADEVNIAELLKLEGVTNEFKSECMVTPNLNLNEHELKDLYRTAQDVQKHNVTPTVLQLRPGAQVMLRWNMNIPEGLANGSRGYIMGYKRDSGFPIVQFNNGNIRTITPHTFEYKYTSGSVSIRQIPLILAWAMTVHKSQGCSLDLVQISMKSIFTPGQAYVALSRARTLEGLSLRDFDPRAIQAHKKVQLFCEEEKERK
jgi:ATP-dependent DNA helicase PIF1